MNKYYNTSNTWAAAVDAVRDGRFHDQDALIYVPPGGGLHELTVRRGAKLVDGVIRWPGGSWAEPGQACGVSASYVPQDHNAETVRQKLLARSEAGIAEHGTTTERDDHDLVDWLTHLQEELMDAAVYVEAILALKKGGGHG